MYRYAGLGIESEFGTAVPATVHLDIGGASLDSPSEPNLTYEGGLSRGIRQTRPGAYISEGNVEYGIDIATIGLFLFLGLGDYTKTGPDENALYTYEIKPRGGRHLPSATVRIGKDFKEQIFPGCCVSQMQMQVEKEFAMATVDFIGGKDYHGDLTAEASLLLPDAYPLAFPDITISIGGSDRSADVESISWTVNNNGDGESGVTMASRFPRRVHSGALDNGLELSVDFASFAEKELFWGDAGGPQENAGPTTQEIIITLNAGDAGSLNLVFPNATFQEVGLPVSGRDRIVQSIKVLPEYDETAGADVVATLITAVDLDTL
jgi:hypothetical protein